MGKPGPHARVHQYQQWSSPLVKGLISKQEMKPTSFHSRKGLHVYGAVRHWSSAPSPTPRCFNHIPLGILKLGHLLVEWPGEKVTHLFEPQFPHL